MDSTNSVVIEHLGDILFDTNEKGKALDAYKQALKLDGDNQSLKEKILSK
jgi:cytochrome c-type biogenesis protein CcmH/NrfG